MPSGMLIGAIIGGGIGLAIMLKQQRRRKNLLAVLRDQGTAAARTALDLVLPRRSAVPLGKLLDQRERMAALAIIGDHRALAAEVGGHSGKLTCVVQTDAIGWLALAIRRPPGQDASEPARQLAALADRVDQEGGITLKLVKRKTRMLARLAAAIAGEQLCADDFNEIKAQATNESPLVKLLLFQGMALAVEAAGGNGESIRAMVREQTAAFDPDPPA